MIGMPSPGRTGSEKRQRVTMRSIPCVKIALAATLLSLLGATASFGQGKGSSASGSLDLGALFALPSNIEAIGKASAAANAPAPKNLTAVEDELYRAKIYQGANSVQAAAWIKSPDGRRHVAARNYFRAHQACAGFEFGGNAAVQAKAEAMQVGSTPIETYKCRK